MSFVHPELKRVWFWNYKLKSPSPGIFAVYTTGDIKNFSIMVNKRYCQTLNENLHISRKLVQIWPNSGNARTGSILWISEIRVTSVFFRIENEKKNEMGNQVEFFFNLFILFSKINYFPWNVIYFPNSARKIHIFFLEGGEYTVFTLGF